MTAETPNLRLPSRKKTLSSEPKLQQNQPTTTDDEFYSMQTPQPIIKSICDGSSIKEALVSKQHDDDIETVVVGTSTQPVCPNRTET